MTGGAKRIDSVDALRGLAVLMMLEVHLGFWWARSAPADDPLVMAGTILGGTGAPLFLLLAGAGLAVSRERRPEGFLRRTAVRGLLLVLTGIVFTYIMQAVYGPWGWGVLQCIGVSLLLTAPLMTGAGSGRVRIGPGHRALIGVGLLLVAPLLRGLAGIPSMLWNDDMASVLAPADYFERMLLSGFFPLLPWAGFVMMGSAAGEWLFCRRPSLGSAAAMALSLAIVGLIMAARGIEMVFFPPSISFTFAVTGICLLVMCAFAKWHVPGTRLLAPMGRLSLTLFVAHHLVGFLGVRAAGGLNSLELLPDLLMVMVSWAICMFLSWLWSAADYRYGLEWLLASAERLATKGINTPPGDSGRRSGGGKDDAPGRAS